jgi:hypothetical protein
MLHQLPNASQTHLPGHAGAPCGINAPCARIKPYRVKGPGNCLQDTLKTSLCANRLLPTARLSCKQLPGPSLIRRLPKLCATHAITTRWPVRQVPGIQCIQGCWISQLVGKKIAGSVSTGNVVAASSIQAGLTGHQARGGLTNPCTFHCCVAWYAFKAASQLCFVR